MTQTEFDARLTGDIDSRLLEFLRSKVNSFVKWDLVRFFHDNPHAADTADNIAGYTGRETAIVERELMGLVEADVLQMSEVSGVKIFRLGSDQAIRDTMNNFVLACDDRRFRMKAIYQVMKGMR